MGSCQLKQGPGLEYSDVESMTPNTELSLKGIRELVEKEVFQVSDLEDVPLPSVSVRRRQSTNCDDAGGDRESVHVE